MKERLGMTELRRKSNRMNFGELQEDVVQDNVGFSLGQAVSGPSSGGRIRAAVVDPKTRARYIQIFVNFALVINFNICIDFIFTSRMSQKLQKSLERQRLLGGGATSVRGAKTAGTASSVTFTPVQGIEIVNPTARQSTNFSSSTYFSPSAAFVKVQTPLPN